MTRKQKRLTIIGGGVSFIIAAVLLVMFAFGQAVAYFYMPSDLAKTTVEPGTRIRLGGLVGENSVKRGEGTTISFNVTDGSATVPVTYTPVFFQIFSARDKALSPKARLMRQATCSWPIVFWPNMMKTTCPRKLPTV